MKRTAVAPSTPLNWTKLAWLYLIPPLLIAFAWANYLADDAYGLLRLAQNLVAGRGMFFDTAVTNSTTIPASPIFLFLLALAGWLHLPLHYAALILSALGWGVTAVTLNAIGREWQRPLAGTVAALFLIFNPVLVTTLGQETAWAVGLGWLASRLGQKSKWRWQTAVLLLLLFTHIDLAVFLFIIYLWAGQPAVQKWRSGLLIPIIGSASLGWLIWQFGLTAVFSLPEPGRWVEAVQSLLQESTLYALLLPWAALGLLIREKRLWPLLLWLLAAAFSGSTLLGSLTAVTLLFLAGLGIEWLQHWLQTTNRFRLTPHHLTVALVLLAGLPQGIAQAASLWQQQQLRPQARLQVEQEAAVWLRQHSSPAATLTAPPRLAYLADRPLQGDGRIANLTTLLDRLPHLINKSSDYFVTYRSPGWTFFTQTSWFQERYQPVRQFSAPYDAGAPLIIWERAPSPFAQERPTPLTVYSDLGVDLVSYQLQPQHISPGEAVHVELNWQNHQTPFPYFRTVVRMISPHDQVAWAQRDLDTPRSLPNNWAEPDVVVSERFVLTTTVDIPTGAYLVTTSLYESRDENFIALYQNEDENALDRISLGYVVVPWNGTPPETAVPINATFGEVIQLLNCDCAATAVPGQTIHIRLYWDALHPPDDNYTVFVHLLDSSGQYITGHDAPPRGGTYDTMAWLPGDIIPDDHPLTLPPDLPTGIYTLRAGLYLPENGTRLPVIDAQGRLLPEGSILLPSLEVVPQNN